MKKIPFTPFFQRLLTAASVGSQQELAQLLGVNRSAITQAKRRDSVPEKWVLRIASDFGLNAEWLKSGNGPVRPVANTRTADGAQGHDGVRDAGVGNAMPVTDGSADFVKIPKVAARLCAGGGSFEVDSRIKGYHAFDGAWLRRKGRADQMVLMDVFGNSMEPEIHEGDVVLVDQSQTAIMAGGIYAVGLEDTVMVKRVEKRPGSIVLISDNTDYSPVHLRGEEIDLVRVVGKVVWVAREYI